MGGKKEKPSIETWKQSFLIQIYFLDNLLFQKVLPVYKVWPNNRSIRRQTIFNIRQEKVRGPNLEFEHLEKELSNSSVWPPLGKNNDIKVGESWIWTILLINVNVIVNLLFLVKLLFNVYLETQWVDSILHIDYQHIRFKTHCLNRKCHFRESFIKSFCFYKYLGVTNSVSTKKLLIDFRKLWIELWGTKLWN